MYEIKNPESLDVVHHVAIQVQDVGQAANWYRENFRCETLYEDATWAFLAFANTRLALVVPGQHPPHVCFEHQNPEIFGELTTHRDGTRTIYVKDPDGNAIELIADAD